MDPWDPLSHPPLIQVRKQESDSDDEGGLGNVTRVVVRPPGHSGKAKRGHLSFDASFECGNLGRVDFISEFEFDLFIRPDSCNPRHRFWFNFVVDNVRTDQRIVFNVVNLCKTKSLWKYGMTPLVRTSSRPKWQRINSNHVFYHKSPEHRHHSILSFAFVFDREDDVYQFATSFPYSYSRQQSHTKICTIKYSNLVKQQQIALSLQNRVVDLLSIGNPVAKRPKTVFILSRLHPGDSPTSFIAQGLIDFLLSCHPIALALRDHVVVQVVPMANPDGVFMGNYRSSLMGFDLNRVWNGISAWAHPTLFSIRNHLLNLVSCKKVDLDLVIDLHCHSSLLGCFIYGNSYEDVYRFERHILFPKLLAHNTCADFSHAQTMYNRDASKAGTARRALCECLPSSVNVYSLHVSLFGYTQSNTGHVIPYNEDSYFRIGRVIAKTLFDYYKATGVIPASLVIPQDNHVTGIAGKHSGSRHNTRRKKNKHTIRLKHVEDEEEMAAGFADSSSSSSDSSDESTTTTHLANGRQKTYSSAKSNSSLTEPNSNVPPLSDKQSSSPSLLRFSSKHHRSNKTMKEFTLVPTKCTTFDFSLLSSSTTNSTQSNRKRAILMDRMEKRRQLRLFGCCGRKKVGGGGVIAAAPALGSRDQYVKERGQTHSTTGAFDPPFLTIVDLSVSAGDLKHRRRVQFKRERRRRRLSRVVEFLTDYSAYESEDTTTTAVEDSDGYFSAPTK